MSYEFVQTADGWRVFWGIDPQAGSDQFFPDVELAVPAEGDILAFARSDERTPCLPAA
jgi:hypothetical protein